MKMTERDDFAGKDDLEAHFAAARQVPARMPERLAHRILADALAVQSAAAPLGPQPKPPGAGVWTQLRQALGGWYGFGGLAAACAAGVWLGFSPPSGLDPLALLTGSRGSVNLLGGDDFTYAALEGG